MENKPLNKNWKKKKGKDLLKLHLGNYFGAIIQFLELHKAGETATILLLIYI